MCYNEKVSIIVPVYNVEKYLNKCVSSIVSQTYTNIEIILVDDGSKDSSSAMCDEWKAKDKRIKVVHKMNGGLSDARNVGVSVATGEYICFIDSDDFISSRFIEILYSLLLETKSDIAICSFVMVNDGEDIVQEIKTNERQVHIYTNEEAIKELFKNSFGDYAWNKLYKRALFNSVKYPIGRKMEDVGTTYLLFDQCNKISFTEMPLYYYLQREGSILHNIDRKYHVDKYSLWLERYKYLCEHHPNLYENKLHFTYVLIADYPYLQEEDKKSALAILKELWPNVQSKMKIKYRLYGRILLLCPSLYGKVFLND